MTDTRPAWLWNAEGTELVWGNAASRLFRGKIKKSGIRLKPRSGADPGANSTAHPARDARAAQPCPASVSGGQQTGFGNLHLYPVRLWPGMTGLLAIGVDAIDPELLEEAGQAEHSLGRIFGDDIAFALFDAGGELLQATGDFNAEIVQALADAAKTAAVGERMHIETGERTLTPLALKAGPGGALILVFDESDTGAAANAAAPVEPLPRSCGRGGGDRGQRE